MLVEGVAVLPENVAKLKLNSKLNSKLNVKVIFLIGDENNTEEVISHATQNSNDWLHKYGKDQLKVFCKLNQTLHDYFESEAHKHGFKVIKIDSKNFKESTRSAAQYLLS